MKFRDTRGRLVRYGLTTAIIALALIPSARHAWEFRDMPHLGHLHDDGIYWVCAKSLAEDTGYRIMSLPEQPLRIWKT